MPPTQVPSLVLTAPPEPPPVVLVVNRELVVDVPFAVRHCTYINHSSEFGRLVQLAVHYGAEHVEDVLVRAQP